MNLVFDTSALSALLGDDDKIIEAASESAYTSFSVPLATDAELRFGYAYGTKQAENLKIYDRFCNQFGAIIVAPDHDTAVIYADLATWCRKNGISLSNNDLWIAATTVQLGGKLLTLDKDFAHLPQVSLVSVP